MTQEDKQLLLADLCARLPYEVYAETINELGETHINRISPENINLVFSGWFKDCKPYLRPMFSMTEEERAERTALLYELEGHINEDVTYKYQDWLNAHHLDYRGLIEKNLAIAITKENNPYKTLNYEILDSI